MTNCFVDMESKSIADLNEYYSSGKLLGWMITRINVPVRQRGKGHGRALLHRILTEADRERITLYLGVQPSGGLTRSELEAWYMRHGFKRWAREGMFRRRPQ